MNLVFVEDMLVLTIILVLMLVQLVIFLQVVEILHHQSILVIGLILLHQ